MRWLWLTVAIYFAICAVGSPGYFGALSAVYAFVAGKAFSKHEEPPHV